MTAPTVSIVVKTTMLDTPEINRRLFADEIEILRRHADGAVVRVKSRWVGWAYKGRNPASVGRSRAGWKRKLQATQRPFKLTILDEATGYYSGKQYVEYVHRSGSAALEYLAVFDDLDTAVVPPLVKELSAAILRNIATPGPERQVRENKEAATATATFT